MWSSMKFCPAFGFILGCFSSKKVIFSNWPISLYLNFVDSLDSEERLQALNFSLKQKIRKILKKWTPDSEIALRLLKPWKNILDKKDWEEIIYRDVLPKLFFFMEKFEPNPESKDCLLKGVDGVL